MNIEDLKKLYNDVNDDIVVKTNTPGAIKWSVSFSYGCWSNITKISFYTHDYISTNDPRIIKTAIKKLRSGDL